MRQVNSNRNNTRINPTRAGYCSPITHTHSNTHAHTRIYSLAVRNQASKTMRLRVLQKKKHELQAAKNIQSQKIQLLLRKLPWLRKAIDWVTGMNNRLKEGRTDG